MKILSILLLIILLALTTGCGIQGTSANPGSSIPLDVREATSNPAPYETEFAQLQAELDALGARLTNLEEKVSGVPYQESRLWPAGEDTLSKLEKRISAIEEILGIGIYQRRYMPTR